jgi:peptidoglycan/LPS O-acetylase OafA/YrhL
MGGEIPARERMLGLDLLRSFAIGAVLVSHFGDGFTALYGMHQPVALSHGGFYGVELFFVLSGFLIGRILLDLVDRDRSPRAWMTFMLRRWLRTLPLYYLWLVVLLLALPPAEQAASHLLRYASFTQNLAWPMPADNWFGVSWTLAVEEWFYLLFSVALFLLLQARRGTGGAWSVILLFLLLPLGARLLWVAPSDWTGEKAVLFGLDPIAYGVLAAAIVRRRAVTARQAGMGLLLGVLLLGVATQILEPLLNPPPIATPPLIMLGFFVATCAGYAFCLPAAAVFRGGTGWLPATIRLIARLSYSLYIVHLSVLEFFSAYAYRGMLSRPVSIILTVVLTALVAWALNRFVEAPIIARRPPQYAPQPTRIGGVAATLS